MNNPNISSIEELLENIQDTNTAITDITEEGFVWTLPNGIIVRVYLTDIPDKRHPERPDFIEWYVGYSYIYKGKERALTHSHLTGEEILEELRDIKDGTTFWVTKTNIFGKASPPLITDKQEFAKIKNKDRYRIYKGEEHV